LNRFAVRAGAKHVFAVDASNMIDNARKIVDANGMSSKITCIKGRVEDAKLPKIDIIVSEWMGFCLLSEIMLDCLLHARDVHLVSGGLIFPDKTSLYIAGIEDEKNWIDKVDCKYSSVANPRYGVR
jgi:type I protein arginine methyltransferase